MLKNEAIVEKYIRGRNVKDEIALLNSFAANKVALQVYEKFTRYFLSSSAAALVPNSSFIMLQSGSPLLVTTTSYIQRARHSISRTDIARLICWTE